MSNLTAHKLEKNIPKILNLWEERVIQEIEAANDKETNELTDSLPEYLRQLVDALSTSIDRTSARKRRDKIDSTRIGKRHGEDRAGTSNYTMDQLITEYHILRQVIFDVMESEGPLNDLEREVIVCSIEQAVNDAATEYSNIMKEFRENMANSLAHDLRNPITSARISAELVLRKLKDDASATSKMMLIINNMDRLNQMISDLLDASKIESVGPHPVVFKICDLNEVIKSVISEFSLAYLGDLDVKSFGKCEGLWDENGLRRIIENLLTNSIKYGEENRKITISSAQERNFAVLKVHNFGKVIPQSEVPTLFEHFKRAKSVEDKAGWGIGLTTVKDLVDAHHGSIQVKSDEVKGTTFIIRLPLNPRMIAEVKFNKNLPPQIAKDGDVVAKH